MDSDPIARSGQGAAIHVGRLPAKHEGALCSGVLELATVDQYTWQAVSVDTASAYSAPA